MAPTSQQSADLLPPDTEDRRAAELEYLFVWWQWRMDNQQVFNAMSQEERAKAFQDFIGVDA